MQPSSVVTWEDRLTRFSFALLLLAIVYGVFVGAMITMYYDIVPDMGSLEDDLGAIPLLLFFVAVLVGLSHLLFVAHDIKHKLWKQASMRLLVSFGPLLIFLGTEGFVAHLVWWDPISETDRFHMLHHNLLTGVPLLLAYWLLLRWWWRPASLSGQLEFSRGIWLAGATVFALIIMALGITFGLVPPIVFAVTAAIALLVTLAWWAIGRTHRNVQE